MRPRLRPAALLVAGFALLLLLAGGAGAAEPVFPVLTGRVVHEAGVLSPQARDQIGQMLARHEQATGEQIVVATVKSLQGFSIEEFGYRLGRSWRIGQKGRDNGAILLVAPNERKVRIEVGYGLEGRLTDAQSRIIIEQVILPAFRNGDFNTGVEAGAAAMRRVLGGEQPVADAADQLDPRIFLALFIPLWSIVFFGVWGIAAQGSALAGPRLPFRRLLRRLFRRVLLRRRRIVRRRRRFRVMVTARSPLSPAEHQRVDAALGAAERRTGAHFALAVVSASDRYALFPIAWAAVLALSATGVLALMKPALTIGEGFFIDAGLFILLSVILDWRPLRLRVVPAAIKRNHARALAHREFASRILANAQHRNGVLFFVSLGERYVEVLADRETHARVAPGTWEKLVAEFIAAVKGDRLADGFVVAIETCGAVLGEHYPRTGAASL